MREPFYAQKKFLDDVFSTEAGPVPSVVSLKVKEDERGFFSELWYLRDALAYPICWLTRSGLTAAQTRCLNASFFSANQLNVSYSQPGVLRGLHWQLPPADMCKFVTCLTGSIYDIVVDIRKDSPTFKKALFVPLSLSSNVEGGFNSIFVPAGFAHGFLVPVDSEPACVLYAYDKYYDPKLERNCSALEHSDFITSIGKTKLEDLVMSEKDRNAVKLDAMAPEDLF